MNSEKHKEIVVRKATRSDLDRLVEFNAAMALETEEKSLDLSLLRAGVQGVFENPARGIYMVGEVRQEQSKPVVAGQLLITYEWSDWRNANFWWIQSVYVHKDWRKQGVFHALYRSVYEQAEEHEDVCGVRLYVEQENTGALAVYAKLGLERTTYRVLERDFVLPPKLADSKDTP